jgi:glycine oxidase
MCPAAPPGRAAEVVVIGGGVIGLATAWRLSQRGVRVTVVDPSPLEAGHAASWSAAGMLAPVSEVSYGEEPLLRLNLASRDRWADFAAELAQAAGQDPGYRETGTLLVARDRDDREALDDLHRFMRGLGLEAEPLRSRQTRQLEPGLAPSTRGGIHVPDDHQVDNRALVRALERACRLAGVTRIEGRVRSVTREGDRATGVRLADAEDVPAGTVVLAAGAWSAAIGGLPDGAVPVRPVRGQLIHLRGEDVPPLAQRVIRGLDVYVVPRGDGRVVVGATVEEQGFDLRPTAGGVLHLLREAYELIPGITELKFEEVTVGPRPGTPDNAPLVGPGPLEGLVIATGHHRNGVLLTPITADAVAEVVVRGDVPPVVEPFDPGRFARKATFADRDAVGSAVVEAG